MRNFRLLMTIIILLSFLTKSSVSASTVYFSNVGNDKNTNPPLETYTTLASEYYNGIAMVKLTDLANVLGGTVYISGNNWFITRNGQTTQFVYNSYTMSTSNVYSIYNPATSSYVDYTQTWSSSLSAPAKIINNYKYVPYESAAKQLGALIAGMVDITAPDIGYQEVVYDFRVNGTSPLPDTNTYIVGGSWITDWSLNGSDNLSPHFEIDEIWSNINQGYARQMKIAITSLESAERVRYYYNNNSSMVFVCAFRSWACNINTSGSTVNSFHMRGRAWDCATDALYTSVFNEFRNGQDLPLPGGYWISRIPLTGNSRGYEIEKMELKTNKWLHLQRQPGYDTAPEKP